MIYTVELPNDARSLVFDGKTRYVVSASSPTSALSLVKDATDTDLDAIWDNATVTEIAPDLEGISFNVTASGGLDVTVVAGAGDTFQDVAVDLVAAITLAGGYANPAWNVDTPYSGTLVIDDGTGGVGDETVAVAVTAADGVTDLTALFTGDIVHEDAALVNDVALDLEDYEFVIQAGALATATYLGLPGDTLDDVGTGLVAALAAAGGGGVYNNPAWTLGGPLYGHLLVDDGTGTIGDLALTITVTAPDGVTDVTASFGGIAVDLGIAADPLSTDIMAGVMTTSSPLSLRIAVGTDEAVI